MKTSCTEPCGNATCLPCPRGTFLTWGNHFKSDCTRCQACDEMGEGAVQGSGDSCRQRAIQKAGLGPACGCEAPVFSPPSPPCVLLQCVFLPSRVAFLFPGLGLWSSMSSLTSTCGAS